MAKKEELVTITITGPTVSEIDDTEGDILIKLLRAGHRIAVGWNDTRETAMHFYNEVAAPGSRVQTVYQPKPVLWEGWMSDIRCAPTLRIVKVRP